MIKVKNLSGSYGQEEVLHQLQAEFPVGKVNVIIGPNGCGKSSLLKSIIGLLPKQQGEIYFGEESLTKLTPKERAKRIAYLPQSKVSSKITVFQMVLHGRFPHLSYPRRYTKRDNKIAQEALETMGIENLAGKSLSELSGGTVQKVYLAMILAQQTPVILMDEPTANLDVAHQKKVMEEAKLLAKEGKTVIMVLHDLTQVFSQADHLVIMERGRIRQMGSPEEIYHSDVIQKVFGISMGRFQIGEEWKYYYC